MEKREENVKKHLIWKQANKGYYSYKRNNMKNYKQHGSFGHLKFNSNRDKNMRYTSVQRYWHVERENVKAKCQNEAAPWSEEALELKRKQQVSDTANKLLHKLKKWSTEKDERIDFNLSSHERTKTIFVTKLEKKSNQIEKKKDNKSEQLHHGEKVKNLSGRQTRKHLSVNHDNINNVISSRKVQLKSSLGKSPNQAIENKQKKMHQNIIGELMTMPKENLNMVLVNPKIHPKFEKKMAQIVKENRLLLAQKFRHLAESKINCQGQFQFQSKFIDDVENLIDPDLAVDLCQLPPELIKQMGDIFQLDFDGCSQSIEQQEGTDRCLMHLTSEGNNDKAMNFSDSSISNSLTIPENATDFELIGLDSECQDGNMKIQQQGVGKISVKNFANCYNEVKMEIAQPSATDCNDTISKSKSSVSNHFATCSSGSNTLIKDFTAFPQFDDCFSDTEEQATERIMKLEHSSGTDMCHQSGESETDGMPLGEEKKYCIVIEENENLERKSSDVQTDISLIELDHSAGFQKNHVNNEQSLILEEVDMIDNLIHVLNKRRFLLFLKLVNLDSCKSSNNLKNKLMQAVTNCDTALLKNKKKQNKKMTPK